jgi:Putative 2OG-Fe(II) oxygenase
VLQANYLVQPAPGLTVLFPSYMPHMVFPHQGERERISIAFNLRKEPFP